MPVFEIVAFIIIPLAIFLLGAAGTGIVALIKFTAYLTSSKEAQESTADTVREIADNLRDYTTHTDGILRTHGEKIRVLEYAAGITHAE